MRRLIVTVVAMAGLVLGTPAWAQGPIAGAGGYSAIDWTGLVALEGDRAIAGLLGEAQKPPPSTGGNAIGVDSCIWANDLECDDARFGGTGYCQPGTDASDCRAMALGGDNSCQWAHDGECDEPGIGLGVCTSGTDTADCAPVADYRNRDNSCQYAFNDICEEQPIGDSGTALCAIDSDTADCLGRTVPTALRDHYFGRDDRTLPDNDQMPWRAIGQIEFSDGACTGALVAPDVVLTAAHCFFAGEGMTSQAIRFNAAQSANASAATATIVDSFVNPAYEDHGEFPVGQGNGEDWAFVRLSSPIGEQVGWLDVMAPSDDDFEAMTTGQWPYLISQGGYSWDTGDRLSGHIGCQVIAHFADNSIFHECDTTQGDSGSPIFTETEEGGHAIIAVDSQFFEASEGPFATAYLAVDARAFAEPLARFIAGEAPLDGSGGGAGDSKPGDDDEAPDDKAF